MIINCSHCSGPLLKDVRFETASTAEIELKLKCPHCQKPAAIKLAARLKAHVFVDGKQVERLGDGEGASIRTL